MIDLKKVKKKVNKSDLYWAPTPTKPEGNPISVDMTNMFRRSGLSHSEFAQLAKVSRLTVFNWTSGVTGMSIENQLVVKKLLDAINSASEAGDLPIEGMKNRKAEDKALKIQAIKKIVVAHLKKTT